MSGKALLEVHGLHAGYGETNVLRGIDLTVAASEIVAVLGSNGVGKSTLNRTLSGVMRAREGTIRFEDADVAREKPSSIVARGLIHVPEGRRIFPNMSVRENLDLGSYRRARSRRAQNRDRVLAIGRGLMAEPKLLILDEPSLGLSPLLVEELFALIARIRADAVAVLLVEQNVVQSLEIADRAYILSEGRFVISGSAAALAADPALKRAYLGL